MLAKPNTLTVPVFWGLRQWVADDLNTRYNIGLSPNDVTVTCDIEEARFVAITVLGFGGEPDFSVFAKTSVEKIYVTGSFIYPSLGSSPTWTPHKNHGPKSLTNLGH